MSNPCYGRLAGIASYLHAILVTCQQVAYTKGMSTKILLAETISEAGFKRIGSGHYRSAFVHPSAPGLIFKIQSGWREEDSMAEIEYDLYHNISTSNERARLAECYYAYKSVCVMEFLRGDLIEHVKDSEGLRKKFMKSVIEHRPHYYDAHTENIMLCENGELKIFDYTIN